MSFCASYLPSDVTLLLDVVDIRSINDTAPAVKEQLIQSGQQHYSDMLTLESAPSAKHEQLYQQALAQGTARMAHEVADLANTLKTLFTNQVSTDRPLVLVSLVRAGLPVGVLLQRAFADKNARYALPSVHYGVSIIRDRGLDAVAMAQILANHPTSPIVFVDGWTGKGAIYGELQRSLQPFSLVDSPYFAQFFHQNLTDSATNSVKKPLTIPLVTLADPAGVAWLSASDEDWLMPASLLNSTVSGLISRTLYTAPEIGLHRCVFYEDLKAVDHSLDFVITIDLARQALSAQHTQLVQLSPKLTPTYATKNVITALAQRFNVTSPNRIKPTIAEATRAVLRRDPECVLINDPAGQDSALLRLLCEQNAVAVQDHAPEIAPYRAVTIIKNRHD